MPLKRPILPRGSSARAEYQVRHTGQKQKKKKKKKKKGDRRKRSEHGDEQEQEGGTKFIVRQTTRTSRRRKYPGAEEFVTASIVVSSSRARVLLFLPFAVCGGRLVLSVVLNDPPALSGTFPPASPPVNYSRSAKILDTAGGFKESSRVRRTYTSLSLCTR